MSGTAGIEDGGDLPPAEVRRELVRRGWNQGAILGPELAAHVQLIPHARLDTNASDRWYAVASQDCDVVAGSFAAEPAIEVIALEALPEPDAQRQFLRHPRELHLPATRGEGSLQIVSARIWNRGFLDRRLLLNSVPAAELVLGGREIRLLSSFLQRRYGRAALPDALVERLRPTRAKLEKLVSDFPEEILLVLIGFSPPGEPDPPETAYSLRVYVVLSDDVAYGQAARRRSVESQVRDRLRPALRKCTGIEVEKVTVCDSDDLSLAEYAGLMELDFDALRAEMSANSDQGASSM